MRLYGLTEQQQVDWLVVVIVVLIVIGTYLAAKD